MIANLKKILVNEKVGLLRVALNDKFIIQPYLTWFEQNTIRQITSYYHYQDQLTAFTSKLLQKYYLAYLCNQERIQIAYTKYHKPYIANLVGDAALQFNIAHSYKQVVLVVYRGSDYYIGVDIEQIHESFNIDELESIVFSATERQLINGSAVNFYKLWTKKESLIKALGTGFATDFYQTTTLNLDDYECTDKYQIITRQIDNYFLSVCLYKSDL